MGAAGVFAPDERVELLAGEIYGMAPIGSRLAGIARHLRKRLERAVGDTAVVGAGDPVNLSNDSEPQPDLLVFRSRATPRE
jgi:Uma2 family endonuclease